MGDRYQHLYSWYELLGLLGEEQTYAYGIVEHPDAGGADDVTLWPADERSHGPKLLQVKWHADQRHQYSAESLLGKESGELLRKLFHGWQKHRDQRPEIHLISNWSADPELGKFIAENGRIKEAFYEGGPDSAAGRIRQRWREGLHATDDEAVAFCRSLRLHLGFPGRERLEKMLDDLHGRHGLQIGQAARAQAIDQVVRWIDEGQQNPIKITREVLHETIHRLRLRKEHAHEPPICVWIHGWTGARGANDRPPTSAEFELDWTAYFNHGTKQIATEVQWQDELLPQLISIEALCNQRGARELDLRGKLPLTAGLATGWSFPAAAGYVLQVEQPTGTKASTWRSDAAPMGGTPRTRRETKEGGDDVLVMVAITGPLADVSCYRGLPQQIAAVVYVEPERGPGSDSLAGDAEAVALATAVKDLIRAEKVAQGVRTVHLVVFGPLAFCIFLGQRLNALGRIITYERTADEGYRPSVILETG